LPAGLRRGNLPWRCCHAGTAELSPQIRVTPQTPPCFFAQAHDDRNPVQDGKDCGFDTPSLFGDGRFERSSGALWQPYHGRTGFDMRLCQHVDP
jgi:hypothetical protein